MSWNQELKMGQDANKQIIEQYGLYNDPKVQAYVEQVGTRVLQESDLRRSNAAAMYQQTPIKFQVLDSPVVNAFAIPGYVYVTRGLLSHVENEAQLAVVLGHEIGHIAARHISEQALKDKWAKLGLYAGAIVGGTLMHNPEAANQLMSLGGAASQLLTKKFSRDDEREADRLGVRYAATEGYRVVEAAGFFDTLKRLQGREGATMPSWMSTHPDPGEREQTILRLAQQYQPPGAMQVRGQDELLSHIDGLVVGNNPREGFVEGNTFYHPEMGFEFPVPAGWKVNNERSAVVMAAPDRSAVMMFGMAPGKTARNAAAAFVQQEGMQVLKANATQVNGLPGYAVVGQASTSQGMVGVLNYFLQSGNAVYQFMGISPAGRFSGAQNAFMGTMQGFSRITDPRYLNVEPDRLTIVTTDRPGTFASFLPTGRTRGLKPQDVAIMNHVELNSVLPAGTKLKVPRSGLGP